MNIGDIEIISLIDGEAILPKGVMGAVDDGHHTDLLEEDGSLKLPIGCFLVVSGDKKVLIDCGMGPTTFEWVSSAGIGTLHGGALSASLKHHGLTPDDIDLVLPTHLHANHVGGLVQNQKLFFPNADIAFGAGDWSLVDESNGPAFKHCLYSLREDGRVHLIEDDGEVVPGISAYATPGHTPGHTSYIISSGDSRAFILGDIIFCPLQIEFPENEGLADMDRELSKRTRELVLRELEGNSALVGGPRFPGLEFGRVLRGKGRRYWG